MRIVFRADAGPRIGAGHVARCLALAEELRIQGAEIVFAMRREAEAFVAPLRRAGYGLIELPETGDDVGPLLSGLAIPAELLIVDHYHWGEAEERRTRKVVRKIAVIDDLADRKHDADLILDQSISRSACDYAGLAPAGCRFLIGPDFALLRAEFAKARSRSIARRQGATALRRILVSFGGVDSKNMTSVALDGIGQSGVHAKVDVVLGAGAPHLEAVQRRIAVHRGKGLDVALRINVDDMAALMSDADLSLGAVGGTAFERCVIGLPAIAIALADNQESIALALAGAGALDYLGRHDQVDAARVRDGVSGLAAYTDKLKRMSKVAAGICDGQGAGRAADILTELAT
jgi:UDP-2,4-diacetamido-2,4,6-trideoxy-beta-L-altropyranose hydrolase